MILTSTVFLINLCEGRAIYSALSMLRANLASVAQLFIRLLS